MPVYATTQTPIAPILVPLVPHPMTCNFLMQLQGHIDDCTGTGAQPAAAARYRIAPLATQPTVAAEAEVAAAPEQQAVSPPEAAGAAAAEAEVTAEAAVAPEAAAAATVAAAGECIYVEESQAQNMW